MGGGLVPGSCAALCMYVARLIMLPDGLCCPMVCVARWFVRLVLVECEVLLLVCEVLDCEVGLVRR